MKILYISSTHFDYLQDILYAGFVKLLGIENIKTIPFNKSYFLNLKEYPRNLGYTSGNKLKYLVSYCKSFEYDCVIVASAKKDTFEQYIQIASSIPTSVPVVFFDGGDMPTVGGDLKRKNCFELFEKAQSIRKFDYIFKREMLVNQEYDSNVFACPFAFNLDKVKDIPVKDKKYDVSFWAVESDEIRTQALTLMKDSFDCKENGTTLQQSFKEYKRKGDFYLEEIRRCKIVLNFRGTGWDTLRYWEVPALQTCMISQKPQIVIPNEFEHTNNTVYCKDDISDLIDLCNYYLQNEDIREQIALESFKHLQKFHTDVARAKYIIDIINSK